MERLIRKANIGTTVELLREIVHRDIPRITAGWKRKRIMLYAHAGLVAEDGALHRVSDYRKTMLDAEVLSARVRLACSDAWRTIKDLLQRAIDGRRSEGSIDAGRDFVLDRIDDTLEPLARVAGGRAMWSQMKRTAIAATASAEARRAARAERVGRRWRARIGASNSISLGTARAASCTRRWCNTCRPPERSPAVRWMASKVWDCRSRAARCGHRR